MAQAFFEAGVPRQAVAIYPGGGDIGAAVLETCQRSLIFGGTPTVERYRGNPAVQVHGPGFSKILLGDDQVDHWEKYLDLMVDSVLVNSGRSCINCSGIWASRHTEEIAAALAERLGPIAPLPPDDPESQLAAFTVPGVAEAISNDIDSMLEGDSASDVTTKYRNGDSRLVKEERCDYLRPTAIHCSSAEVALAHKEYMFPFVSVVRCPQDKMLASIGDTLVASVLTENVPFQKSLLDATHIDRLNFGPIPTIKLNWLQPHEGSIIDFLFRARAFQKA
jgi:acyl-CoA reductase-like NAD-dependent aldehyde dehydrogenase